MDTITIQRTNFATGVGVLSYSSSPGVSLSSTSWEHAGNLIPAKKYTGCSVETMQNRRWKAIYIPDSQTGKTGIFIHKGESQSWSKGCICITEDDMDTLLDLVPDDNITVVVKNPDPESPKQ